MEPAKKRRGFSVEWWWVFVILFPIPFSPWWLGIICFVAFGFLTVLFMPHSPMPSKALEAEAAEWNRKQYAELAALDYPIVYEKSIDGEPTQYQVEVDLLKRNERHIELVVSVDGGGPSAFFSPSQILVIRAPGTEPSDYRTCPKKRKMMLNWFSPPKRVAPGWQRRIGLLFLAIWLGLYLLVGREAFGMAGAVAMGTILLMWIVGFALLQLLDPILRAQFLAKWKRHRR